MAGRGTLRERGNGKWELTVALGVDASGKQIRKYRTVKAKDKREAERLLARFVVEVDSGVAGSNENITVKDFISSWFSDYADKNLAPKTLFRYKQLSERIKTAIGHIKLGKLKPNHLIQFYNNLQEPGVRKDGKENKGLSERTILHYHRLIHTVLETAVQWQYIAANPASRVKPPKVPKRQMPAYDEVQVAAMLSALTNEPFQYQVIVWLALATGMRQGEIMGLEWKHIDFSSNIIRVEQAAQYVPGKGTFLKAPKNETSHRVIAVPTTVMQMIKEHKKQQAEQRLLLGNKWDKSERVFTQVFGKPMYPQTMSTWFPKFLKRHQLPHMNFHGLRHTCASLLIAEGATPVDLSKRLGHSTSSTTLNIYSHSFQKADERLSEKMSAILQNATVKKA